MTREEAIEVLKLVDENASCDDCLYYAQMEDCPTDEDCIIRQALEMAIQALQAQADGEYISRQAVLDELNKWDWQELYLPIHFKENIIDVVPSVKPQESKTGHWKRISMDKYTEHAKHWYECDKCGKENLGDTNFCPNCGADMRGEQDGVRSKAQHW